MGEFRALACLAAILLPLGSDESTSSKKEEEKEDY